MLTDQQIEFQARKLARFRSEGGDSDEWLDSKGFYGKDKIRILLRSGDIDTQPAGALVELARRTRQRREQV